MAEETTTVTPKRMGSHLRAVRRRKGLSLSEVARGAGLNRRELVNYERGKATIPESDLWVLAGSIGVDISELTPPSTPVAAPTPNLPARRQDTGADSIGDAVAMLRRGVEQEEASPLLGTLRMLQQLPEGKRVPLKDKQLAEIAGELGGDPAAVEAGIASILRCDPHEAARVRAIVMGASHQGHGRRGRRAKAIGVAAAEPIARYQAPAVPPPPPTEPAPTEHVAVDVFEELARLPEPLPLREETALPDIIGTPPAPEGAMEFVDHDAVPSLGERFGFQRPVMAESTAGAGSTAGTGAVDAMLRGADAPPIDVAMRTDDWGLAGPTADDPLARRAAPADRWAADQTTTGVGGSGWTPPAPTAGAAGTAFWEGTDDWTPLGDDAVGGRRGVEAGANGSAADPNALWSFAPSEVDPWVAGGWPEGTPTAAAGQDAPVGHDWPGAFTPVEDSTAHPADIWGDPPLPGEPAFGLVTPEPLDREPATDLGIAPVDTGDRDPGPWAHLPDQAAAESGFVVDWGDAGDAEPDEPIEPVAGQWASAGAWDEPLAPAWEVQAEATTDEPRAFDAYDAFATDPYAASPTPSADHEGAIEGLIEGAIEDDRAVDEQGIANLTFGSDLAATLAATYHPDGSEEPTSFDTTAFDTTAFDTTAFDTTAFDTTAFDTTSDAEPAPDEPSAPVLQAPEPAFQAPEHAFQAPEPAFQAPEPVETITEVEVEVEVAEAVRVEELPRIVWRADASGNVDAVTGPEFPAPPVAEPPAAVFEETFVTAGPDWQLGNAVPLVEVKSEGALVMRRADERWALADVTAGGDFALEVDVDFRSGPGLGLLFRASVDDQGRMSGYSFDIDPIYDGGGFLVRQWQDDRELWNPIARVAAPDPTAMYGKLTVRLEVHGETLTASVNGVDVMTVDDLARASVERDREAARGCRVGVQAWSSSDLVIDTLRLAAH